MRERLKCGVSDLLTFALRRHSHINGYSDLYKVMGYTSLTLNCRDTEEQVIYYASELKNGTKDTPMIRVKSIGHGCCGHSKPATIQLIKY